MKEIDYYKNNEILENTYYQIPQELFVNSLYKEKCKLNEFTKEERSILEDVIERLYYADNLKVGNVIITHPKILSKLPLINKNNLIQLLDIVKNSSNIKNITNYLMICLYNNLGNNNIKL